MGEEIDRFITDVKGAMAEALVTMLFRWSGYTVKLHGQWKATDLRSNLKAPLYLEGDGTTDHPDLVISRRGEKQLIEVKYRSEGKLYRQFGSNHKLKAQCLRWGNVEKIKVPFSVVIVNQEIEPYITVLQAPYLSEKGWFNKRTPIMEAGWNLRKDLHEECVRLLKGGLFDGVNS